MDQGKAIIIGGGLSALAIIIAAVIGLSSPSVVILPADKISEPDFNSVAKPQSDTQSKVTSNMILISCEPNEELQDGECVEKKSESVKPIKDTMRYGPNNYKSFSDSKFSEFQNSSVWSYRETFDDLNYEDGYVINSDLVWCKPGDNHDSVDIDDGLENGVGRDGGSLCSQNQLVMTIEFDKDVLGDYPNYAGLVFVDFYTKSNIGTIYTTKGIFEAYDTDGKSVGSIGPTSVGIKGSGNTDEDTFFGIYHKDGIKAITFEIEKPKHSTYYLFVDDIQYGLLK